MSKSALEFRNRFGAVGGDVETDGAHGFAGQLTDVPVGLLPALVPFEGAAAKLAEEAFGHLAADRIAGTENQNAIRHGRVTIMLPEEGEEQTTPLPRRDPRNCPNGHSIAIASAQVPRHYKITRSWSARNKRISLPVSRRGQKRS